MSYDVFDVIEYLLTIWVSVNLRENYKMLEQPASIEEKVMVFPTTQYPTKIHGEIYLILNGILLSYNFHQQCLKPDPLSFHR